MYDMYTYLQEYKVVLTIEILNFLKMNYPVSLRKVEAERPPVQGVPASENVTYIIKANNGHESYQFLIDTSEYYSLTNLGNRYENHSNHSCIDLSAVSVKEQQIITNLLLVIVNTDCGYELWNSINSQQERMPGWWSFFGKQRSLALAIAEIQQLYPLDEMTRYILRGLREQLTNLKSIVKELRARIQRLESERRASGHDDYEKRTALIIELEADKQQALETIKQLSEEFSILRIERNDLNAENKRMHRQLTDLLSDTTKAIQSIEPSGVSDPDALDNLNRQHARYRTGSRPASFALYTTNGPTLTRRQTLTTSQPPASSPSTNSQSFFRRIFSKDEVAPTEVSMSSLRS